MDLLKRCLALALLAAAAWAGPKSAVLIDRSGSMKPYYRDLVVRQLSGTLLEALRAQGGDVWFESRPERGTTFVLTQTSGNNSDIGGVMISSENNVILNAPNSGKRTCGGNLSCTEALS